jgi:hypothetical protein
MPNEYYNLLQMTNYEADDFLREVPEPVLQLARNIIRFNTAIEGDHSAVMVYSAWRDVVRGEAETTAHDDIATVTNRLLDTYGNQIDGSGFRLATMLPDELRRLRIRQGLTLDAQLRHIVVDGEPS